jgi:hypothetical protein
MSSPACVLDGMPWIAQQLYGMPSIQVLTNGACESLRVCGGSQSRVDMKSRIDTNASSPATEFSIRSFSLY